MNTKTMTMICVTVFAAAGCGTHGSVEWPLDSNAVGERPAATAVILTPSEGSIISDHRIQVDGHVADLPEDDELIVMLIDSFGMYHVQWPPCRVHDDGSFSHRNTRIAIDPGVEDIEKHFEILLLQASSEAVHDLQSSVNRGAWQARVKPPSGTKTLDSVLIRKN